jgi:hypothetical protein
MIQGNLDSTLKKGHRESQIFTPNGTHSLAKIVNIATNLNQNLKKMPDAKPEPS